MAAHRRGSLKVLVQPENDYLHTPMDSQGISEIGTAATPPTTRAVMTLPRPRPGGRRLRVGQA